MDYYLARLGAEEIPGEHVPCLDYNLSRLAGCSFQHNQLTYAHIPDAKGLTPIGPPCASQLW
jgi:hypothetical protein